MALQWIDGFEHYADVADLTLGLYAEAPDLSVGRTTIQTANPRTGTKHYRMRGAVTILETFLRRVIADSPTVAGVGYAIFLSQLPAGSAELAVGTVSNAANEPMWTLTVLPTGQIEVRAGDMDATVIGTSADPALVASSYQHLEAKFDNSGSGEVEVRVNGESVLTATGAPGNAGTISNWLLETSLDLDFVVDIDDLYCWDNSGSTNNDFLGDRQCVAIQPNGDTATADYTVTGAASGHAAISENTPDGDTSYITFAPSPGDQGEFDVENVSTALNDIAGVQWYSTMKKTVAGDGTMQVAMGSSGAYATGADRTITTVYIYYGDIFEVDPNTGLAWSPTSLNAATLRYERTS